MGLIKEIVKPGFHIHNALDALRCMGAKAHKQSRPLQQMPASSQQSLKKYYNDFRKVVISSQIRDVLRDLHAFKYKRLGNKPSDVCLLKPAKCNSVRTSKQLRFVATTETFSGNQALNKAMNWPVK